MIDKIDILGLRGYSTLQTINLANPNGKMGSGLTVIVGSNNTGKSTILEAFRAVSSSSSVSVNVSKRNTANDLRIEINVYRNEGKLTLKTVQEGGAETEFLENGISKGDVDVFTLPSRRSFRPNFGKSTMSRESFIRSANFPSFRGETYDTFYQRLFEIQKNKTVFNSILEKIIGYELNWVIDQDNYNQYFLNIIDNNSQNSSDGLGEGLISIFTIIDALYDSKIGDVIFIDEPELSLHPAYQKKLTALLVEYSKDRQIIISTHSPYFVDWTSICNGGNIIRTVKEKTGCVLYNLQDSTKIQICKLKNNFQNPHILGLESKEVFFLEDNIILMEGQEDVIFFTKILNILEIDLTGTYYGWGVGGAANMDIVITLLSDLGFKKVSVIFDNNESNRINSLLTKYPDFKFFNIPTDDIRDKLNTPEKKEVKGLIDHGGKNFDYNYEEDIKTLCKNINNYFNPK